MSDNGRLSTSGWEESLHCQMGGCSALCNHIMLFHLPTALHCNCIATALRALSTRESWSDASLMPGVLTLGTRVYQHTLRRASIATAMIWSDDFTNFTAITVCLVAHTNFTNAHLTITNTIAQAQLQIQCNWSCGFALYFVHFDKSICFAIKSVKHNNCTAM